MLDISEIKLLADYIAWHNAKHLTLKLKTSSIEDFRKSLEPDDTNHVCRVFINYYSRGTKQCHDCGKEYPINVQIQHQRG